MVKGRDGYSLIEYLLLIMVVGIVIWFFLIEPNITKIPGSQKADRGRELMRRLGKALYLYRDQNQNQLPGMDMDDFESPGNHPGPCVANREMTQALGPVKDQGKIWVGLLKLKGSVQYLNGEPLPYGAEINQHGEVIDPWGRPIRYRAFYTNDGMAMFNLWSLGPNEKDSGDDIFYRRQK